MNSYTIASLYDALDNAHLGDVIVADGQTKLYCTHYYRPGEKEALQDRLQELENEQDILRYWPAFDDPQVQALVQDETFEPLEKEWQPVPVEGPDGNPLIHPESGHDPERPWEARLLTKQKLVPKSPAEAQQRVKTAMELVARARMEAGRA